MPEPTPDERPPASAGALFIIRLSFVITVGIFGAVTWLVHSRGERAPAAPDPALDWVVIGVWAAVAVALMVLSRRYRNATRRADRVSLAIIGWALGEAAALLGGVHYFISGNPLRYGYGLLLFAVALLFFPIPQDHGPRLER